MAFTDHCSIFGSFHEEGFNRIIKHIQLQRPSLFNYATEGIAKDERLLCSAIKVHPVVDTRKNPHVTILPYLQIPSVDPNIDYGIEFAAQLSELLIDFAPGNLITLPSELSPPLPKQRLSIYFKVCAGIGCANPQMIGKIDVPTPPVVSNRNDQINRQIEGRTKRVIPIPFDKMHCFCLDVYAVGGARITNYNGQAYLEPFIDNLEIVDIRPAGLESSLECLILMLLRLSILPKLKILLKDYVFDLPQGLGTITIGPTPISAAVPYNPAIEEDRIKAFINLSA